MPKTWDTFAVSVIYFSMAQAFLPNYFLKYHELLVKNMVALPSMRETPMKMQEKLSSFLANSANTSVEYSIRNPSSGFSLHNF